MRARQFLLTVAAIVTVATINVATPADAAVKRISFARGASQATVSGRWHSADDEQVFLLRVRAGQTIRATGASGTTIFISDPNGDDVTDADASCNSNKSVSPTVAGDYRLYVSPCLKFDPVPMTYRLTVRVR